MRSTAATFRAMGMLTRQTSYNFLLTYADLLPGFLNIAAQHTRMWRPRAYVYCKAAP